MRVFEDWSGLVRYKIFISSVQREFAKERKALAEYVRKDDSLGFNASQTAPKHHGDALDDALEARLLDASKVVRVGGKRFGHWEVIG